MSNTTSTVFPATNNITTTIMSVTNISTMPMSSATNFTTAPSIHDPISMSYAARIPMAMALYSLIPMGLTGNVLVCMALYRRKELRTLTNWFILNLSIADLGVLIFCTLFPLVTYSTGEWHFSEAACQFDGLINSILFLTAILTLAMISLHQYLTVVAKWKTRRLRKSAIVMLSVAWLVSLAVSVLPLLKIGRYGRNPGRGQCSVLIPTAKIDKLAAMVYIIVGFVIPVLIILVCYAFIIRVVMQHSKQMRKSSSTLRRNAVQRKVVFTMIIVLTTFMVCWTPFLIMSIFGAFIPELSSATFGNFAFMMGYLNSCCNPIVLGVRSKGFRRAYFNILKDYRCWTMCCCCCKVDEMRLRGESTYQSQSQDSSNASNTRQHTMSVVSATNKAAQTTDKE